MTAPAWMGMQAAADDKADVSSTATSMTNPVSAVNFNMGTLIESYATVASLLEELATVPGVKGIMLTFDHFVIGMQDFGRHIQPPMKSRADVQARLQTNGSRRADPGSGQSAGSAAAKHSCRMRNITK
jgi:pyrimidine oxygenase